nr:hypothetical protein CFP56_61124 [Quercus suber]
MAYGDGSQVSDLPSDPLIGPQSVPDVLPHWNEEAMALALQYEEDAYAATTQSLHPNSAFVYGDGSQVSYLPSNPLFIPQSVPDMLPHWNEEAMALALQYEEDAYETTTQSLYPNSAEAKGVKDVQRIVEEKRVDDVVNEDNIDTKVNFRLLGKRKQIDHPTTRPCDVCLKSLSSFKLRWTFFKKLGMLQSML